MLGILVKNLISSVNAAVAHNVGSNGNGRGWGESIDWVPIFEAEKVASGKPIMLIVHRSTCQACQDLKAKFSADTVIPELSRNFVMVNAPLEDFQSVKLQPDVTYVPSIMFYHPNWSLLDLKGDDRGNHYYYGEPAHIRSQMKSCLNMLKIAH